MNRKGIGLNHERGIANHRYKHGLSLGYRHSRIYSSWANMVQRCTNPKSKDWKNYGGKGIMICGALRKDASILRKCIGDPPVGHTLNRIDNDGHYSCGWCGDCWEHNWKLNIEWSNATRQSRNRGKFLHRITLHGETHCISEWSEILGIKLRTLRGRISRGWPDHEILSLDISTNAYKRR